MKMDAVLAPGEFLSLKSRDLRGVTCVVFDILRATSSMMVALAHGAAGVIPVQEIAEAMELKRRNPKFLLAGERHGLKITAGLTKSIDFDFGNSPREFRGAGLAGADIVMTTTNGTRALKACEHAESVLIGSFLNLNSVVDHLRVKKPDSVLLVCAGTYEEASFEDTLAAGAVADGLWNHAEEDEVSDAAQIVREIFLNHSGDLLAAMNKARNGRRLLKLPELSDDVPFCLRLDEFGFVAGMRNGRVERLDAR